jgi:hypothetical protein
MLRRWLGSAVLAELDARLRRDIGLEPAPTPAITPLSLAWLR